MHVAGYKSLSASPAIVFTIVLEASALMAFGNKW